MHAGTFADNPIIYHLIIDRFLPSTGKFNINRSFNADPLHNVGTFHGGDLAGVTHKLKEGWFSLLGVNAILISAPYQQIMGWIPGGHAEFKHYAYHGYYALDYTTLDPRFGTERELLDLVTTAHRMKIRILFDVVMNHPGYADLQTLHELDVDVVLPGWEDATPSTYHQYIDYGSPRFSDWWGGSWVRCGLPGYIPGGDDDLTMQLACLPDFRTECEEFVCLPKFIKNRRTTNAIEIPNMTVRDYLVEWLIEWVRQYGIDGFRCDSAKHVELDAWRMLKEEGVKALREWKDKNSNITKIDDAPFWMTGEVFGNGIDRNRYFDFGFDSLINFHFQGDLTCVESLDALFSAYANKLSGRPGYNVLSYISSHDTYLFDRANLLRGGIALMLAPGGVQIFYGDETARPSGPIPRGDSVQATRSDMNWESIDNEILSHWRKLGQFRSRHIAIARGVHRPLQNTPLIFERLDIETGDRVVVAIDLFGEQKICVKGIFEDGELVHDAYSGTCQKVISGRISLCALGTVLLEKFDH